MKKILSFVLSVCILMASGTFTALAEDTASDTVILSVADATWTLPEGLVASGSNDYGSETPNAFVAVDGEPSTEVSLDKLGEDTYVTYTNIPEGVYKVEYYYPEFAGDSYKTGRQAQVLDSDLAITDANGTHIVKSTKPSITFAGWTEIGTYEFAENGNSIKVTANQDNKIFKAKWNKRFVSSQIRLTPVTEDHSALITAVNAATDASALKTAVSENNNGFVNASALTYMGDVYTAVLAAKPADGFASAYAFKTAFENAVEAKLTKNIVNSSSFVWQNTDSNLTSAGYRINWSPVEFGNGSNLQPRAIVTFKLDNVQNLKSMNLKLNANSDSDYHLPLKITQYSSSVITLPSANKEQSKTIMANAEFTELATPISISVAEKEISDAAIIAAAKENGYISFYIERDTVEVGTDSLTTKLTLNATLKTVCDNTSDPSMSLTEASVNTAAKGAAKVFDLSGFDTVSEVKVNKTVLDKSKYSFNGARLLIDASVFENAKNYTVEVSNGSETRNVALRLVDEKIIYAQDSENVTWSATAQNLNTSMTRPDETHNLLGVSNSTDTSVTYSNIPNGAYEVYTYYPKWLSTASCSAGRTSGIYDNSAEIADANGTHTIKSTKPSINFEGYTSLGVYEFSENADEQIKLSVNKDYSSIVSFMGTPYFANYAIKLVPVSNDGFVKYYYDKGEEFAESLNKSENEAGLVEVIKDIAGYVDGFIDTEALYDMSGVYDKLYNMSKNTDFKTEYDFKTAFDKAVSEYIEIKEIPSSLMISTYTDDGEILNVTYRKNATPSLSDIKKSYAFITFDGVSELEPEAITDVWLKMNTTTYADDYYLTKYSKYSPTLVSSESVSDGPLDGNSEENIECNVWLSYFSPVDEKLLTPFFVNIDSAKVKEAATENSPLTYYIQLKNKITDYNSANKFTGATLKIGYDTTYEKSILEVAGEVSTAETFEEAKEITKKYAAIFDIDSNECDAYALALWNEHIETKEDFNNCINVSKDDCHMRKSVEILTDSEYIGGVTVKNFGTSETPVKVIAAAYDNSGRLIDMDYADRETALAAGDAYVYAFSVNTPESDTVYSVKVFAWGDMINIVPLAGALEVK